MALNNLGLGFVFTAQDLASPTMNKLGGNFGTFDSRVQKGSKGIGGGFNTIALGAQSLQPALDGIVAGIAQLADMAGSFEQKMAAVGAITGATAEDMMRLEEGAIAAGLATQFSPGEAADALTALAQAGLNVDDSLKVLKPSLDLATASLGKLGVADAANTAITVLKTFSLTGDEASFAIDRLVKGSQSFKISIEDLPLLMGNVARGALSLNASFDDTVIAAGLAKNVLKSTEQSASSVAIAMERMTKVDVQKALKDVGVAVVDADGNFNDFLDIITDLSPALADMTQAEKAAFIETTFGARAGQGLKIIMGQLESGIATASGEMLKGADAVSFLRSEMQGAEGTAAEFNDALLDTFAGQKQLLVGTVETLIAVIGKPIIKALAPILTRLRGILIGVMETFNGIPEGIKSALGTVLVAVAGIAAAASGLIGAGAIVAGLALAAKLAAIGFSILVQAAIPLIAAIALISAAAVALVVVWQEDLGGLRTFVMEWVDDISLLWDALTQLFTDGGFSGAVDDELQKAQNKGILEFAVTLFKLAFRLEQFWEGLKTGFTSTLEALEPVFTELQDAFKDMFTAWGNLFDAFTDDAQNMPSSEFESWGETVGGVFAEVIGFFATLLTWVVRIQTGWTNAWASMADELGPFLVFVGEKLQGLFDSITELLTVLGILDEDTQTSSDALEAMGAVAAVLAGTSLKILAGAIAVISTALSLIVDVVTLVVKSFKGELSPELEALTVPIMLLFGPVLGLIKIFQFMGTVFGFVISGIRTGFFFLIDLIQPMFGLIEDAVNSVFEILQDVINALPDFIIEELPDEIQDFASNDFEFSFLDGIEEIKENTEQLAEGGDDGTLVATGDVSNQQASIDAQLAALEQQQAGFLAEQHKQANERIIQIIMDTEVVGQLTDRAREDSVSRGADSIPTF